ncbi:MAG TPA: hypothetical protein VHL57_04835 [Flavobacteriales bacterium]|jgi:hypothetical protein|nr:hypothetical protein [Flavobacteriales bacterium]
MIRSDSAHGYNDIQASILLTPVDTTDWPPLISMRVGIKVNEQDSITYIDIEHHEPQKVRLTFYDKSTIAEKNAKLYARIRSKLDHIGNEANLILWFEFRNISVEPIRKLAITYGPWEKNDSEKRIEGTFPMEFTE